MTRPLSLLALALLIAPLGGPASAQSTLNGGRIVPGTLPVSGINATGTASSSTYLRGDGSWQTPTAGDHKVILNASDASPDVLDSKIGVTAPLTVGDTSGVRVIGIGPAGAGVSGYLLGSDWSVFSGKEPGLGNPSTSGYVLSSTAAGVRSWIAPASGPTGPAGATGATGPAGPNWPIKNGSGTLTAAPTSLKFGAGLTATASGNDVTVTAPTYYVPTLYCVTPTGAVNGTNETFTLPAAPLNGTCVVFLRGLMQPPGAALAYTLSGTTITFNNNAGYLGPQAGDPIYVLFNN